MRNSVPVLLPDTCLISLELSFIRDFTKFCPGIKLYPLPVPGTSAESFPIEAVVSVP